jgi:hypothetical protein
MAQIHFVMSRVLSIDARNARVLDLIAREHKNGATARASTPSRSALTIPTGTPFWAK